MGVRSVVSLVALSVLGGAGLASAAEVTIGASGPFSGPLAYFGSYYAKGLQMAVGRANLAGGVKGQKIKLNLIDDKADPREGTIVAQKHCDDDATVVVIAHVNAGVTIPSRAIYAECGPLPQVTVSSASRVTQDGFKTLFRIVGTEVIQARLDADYAAKIAGKKVAAVVSDKQAYGQALADSFKAEFEKQGGKVTSQSGINPGDVDFSSVIAKIKTEKPEIVFFGGVMPQVALFRKQMVEQGLDAMYLVPDSGYLPAFIEQAGEKAAQGVIVSFQWPPYDFNDGLKAFKADFIKEYKEEPASLAPLGFMAANVVIEAMNKAEKLDRPSIAKALRGLKYESFVGPIEFDEKGDIFSPPLYIYKISGKDFVLEYPKK